MTKHKILFIEDDRVLCEAISQKLIKEGFEIIIAYNGEEGLAKISSEKPNLILLDILMPKMDGITMLEKLRDSGDETPVIILTNLESKEKIAQSARSGVSGYLIKSNYSLSDIVSLIKKSLNL